ncbi:MAG: protein-disulfide reductase DsbD domain-containing protein [Xanthobacteraceae bacterium]
MMTTRRLTIAAVTLIGLAALSAVASAQDASDWDAQPHSAARLIAGAASKTPATPTLRAGLEIKLDPGWHTYWRDPGDSGVPPTFDFSGSDNVKSATVLWPAPQRFPDGAGGTSIGYVDRVILPVQVAPQDTARQSLLRLKLGYAVCGNLCIPAEAKLQLALNGKGAEDAAIEKAKIRVPRRVSLGPSTGPGNGLAILAVHRIAGTAHDHVVVDVAAPAGASVDLFVEGPTPDWSLPQPEPKGGGDGDTRQFTFDLDGLPSDAHAIGATLTFTVVSSDDAIEVPAHLD